MRFLLSIHDVWPGNFPVVEQHCRQLAALGARTPALLVVPCYHGRQDMGASAEFLAWLRDRQAAGSEVFLHGYHHLMRERLGQAGARSRWGHWVNRRLVGGEAEFCGLPAADREDLLRKGLASITAAGFAPAGFVAPTWHGAPRPRDMASRGLALWESRFHLHHLATGRRRFAPPLAFGPPDRSARLLGGRAWLQALLALPLIKVALHPGDLDSPAVPEILARVLSRGRQAAYRDVFAPSPS